MVVAGIDIGAKGSLVILKGKNIIYCDFKDMGILGYIQTLKKHKVDIVIVEKIHSMPRQGVKSMFSFGQRLGEVEGMLLTLGISYELVAPQIWQKCLGVSPKSDKKDIALTILKRYPQAELYGKKGGLNDGRSDAIGLAHYGVVKYENNKKQFTTLQK